MREDSVESAMLLQSALKTLPLMVLRVLAWLLIGFAITLACGVAGVITFTDRGGTGKTRHPSWTVSLLH